MFFSTWLRKMNAQTRPARRDQQRRHRPWMETLEDRTVLSTVSFSPPISYDVGGTDAGGITAGDFNGDGTPDLAVSDWYANKINVLLGNGDGTFHGGGSIAANLPEWLAAGDFNRDGKVDLIGNRLFLGNGDGTFQTTQVFAGGRDLQVCDLNGDDILDLVSVSFSFVSVTLGNGDGTFRYRSYYAGYSSPTSVAMADFNGDGKSDLVVTSPPSGGFFDTTSLLLGNGDGSFQYPRTIPFRLGAHSVVAGDFNRDGKSDLVVGASVLLGNGDGTFRTGQVLDTIPYSRRVADLNGDGALDLIGDGDVNLGNGDGTFQARQHLPGAGGFFPPVVVDLNGDGKPDVATTTGSSHRVVVHLNALVTTTTLTGPTSSTYGQPVTYTATITSDGNAATGGTVTFLDGDVPLTAPMALDANGQASFSIASLRPGSHTITTSYSGTAGGVGSTGFGPSIRTVALTVNQATLSATAVNITAPLTAGTTFSATVATFINPVPFENATSYYAAIDWGDGISSYGTITGTGTLSVNASHTYADAGNYTPSVTIYHNYNYTTTATVNPTATVTSLGLSVQRGLAGDIGFWHGGSGQALIKSFNGGDNATALSSWLAESFPNLYSHMQWWTNADVAAYYQSLFAQSGPKAAAQVLATALNVYATTLSLGGTAGQAYGFTVTAAGLGAYSFNVGSYGEAFGMVNNTTHTVFAFLQALDRDPWRLYDYSVLKQINDLFDALTKAGRI